jgi:CDP-4-dehydro-6-deoxyglucose reductase, E3
MTYTITLKPSDVTFSGSEQRSLLDSAILSNYILQYGCKDGRCGACKSKLIKGEVDQQACMGGISESEQKNGYVLTCCAKPRSNIEIEADYFPELQGIETKVVPCRVDAIEYPAKDIAIIKLRLPPRTVFEYMSGQYIHLINSGERRSYSIANNCVSDTGIELHIRKVVNGRFSSLIFNELKANQLFRLEGPFGSFFIRKSSRPIIFLAGGTGFAPVKAMVEKLLDENSDRKISIYWGASSIAGFYSELPQSWENNHENIMYVPVYSGKDDSWRGRKGFVHRAVLEDFSSLSDYEVYACGAPEMIDQARIDFTNHGLSIRNFYSDAFVGSS